MKIRLNGDDVKKLMGAVSKDKTREILHCIHIERDGDFLEFAATTGSVLVVLKRNIKKYDDEVPDNFKINIDISNYKLNNKYIYDLIDEGERCVLVGPDTEIIVKLSAGVFPNYHLVTDGYEKLPEATQYASFNYKYMKVLYDVFGDSVYKVPRAKDGFAPHFWVQQGYEEEWLGVLMPLKSK